MADAEIRPAAINAAARILERGGLVAFPTETVYGLGADAENPAAIAKIYRAKGRPSDHPVIVHLPPDADLRHWARDIPPQAERLIEAFWPGPLTLILNRAAAIPAAVSGGQDTIGLRCPSHPVAIALLREFRQGKGGLAAPSANRFGHVSPTTAQHVLEEFGIANPLIGAVLEGGPSEVGIESTIVDLSRLSTQGPVLLRPGHLSAQAIGAVLGTVPAAADAHAPRVSGALDAHYAPATPVALVSSQDMNEVLQKLARYGHKVALAHASEGWSAAVAHANVLAAHKLPDDVEGYARGLYASLRKLDRLDADLIIVETPPQQIGWEAVNDRLRRAAFDSAGVLEKLMRG